jgi:hypothetical protein
MANESLDMPFDYDVATPWRRAAQSPVRTAVLVVVPVHVANTGAVALPSRNTWLPTEVEVTVIGSAARSNLPVTTELGWSKKVRDRSANSLSGATASTL